MNQPHPMGPLGFWTRTRAQTHVGRTVAVVLALSALALWHAPSSLADGSCPSSESDLQTLINGGGPITLSCSGPTTIRFTTTITITNAVTLDASSSLGAITFDGNPPNGDPAVALFNVASSGNFTLSGVTLAHGDAHKFGGAIANNGSATIINSSLLQNRAGFNGGGIENAGTLTVRNSTFLDNEASVRGGAIANTGTLAVANSTFSANHASTGGAIRNDKTASIANSTFSENRATFTGAAIDNAGTLSIGGTIIAASLSGGNCGGTLTDNGYNLEDDPGATCGFSPSRHDIVGQGPLLGSLASNGGPTQTMALQPGSPAIDQVPTATGLCPPSDQRGEPRPDGNESACDIGAYEHDDACPTNERDLQTLIATGGDVTLTCPVATTIPITTTITVTQSVSLDASKSPASITLDGGGSNQLFSNLAALTVNGLTLDNGHSTSGGAIYNDGPGTLSISNSTLSGNSASGSGGAIWNGGILEITNSTLSGNAAADSGGAIDSEANGTLTLLNSTVIGNSANDGGAVANDNTAQIANSTLSGNIASSVGGAISDTGTLSLAASIVAGGGGDNCFSSGGIQDDGYNLEDDAAANCGFSQASNDIVGQNPELGPLASNGGLTQTTALMAGSPAIDHIPTSTGLCPAIDQRGIKRPDGNENVCDIGAYESGGSQLEQPPPAKLELIICSKVTRIMLRRVGHKDHNIHLRQIKCQATPLTGKVKLRGASRALATVTRGHVRYAAGISVTSGRGRLQLLVAELRPLTPGPYTLTLRHRHHGRWIVRRIAITLG